MPTQLCCFALGPDAVGHAERGETTSLTEVFERLLMAESGRSECWDMGSSLRLLMADSRRSESVLSCPVTPKAGHWALESR